MGYGAPNHNDIAPAFALFVLALGQVTVYDKVPNAAPFYNSNEAGVILRYSGNASDLWLSCDSSNERVQWLDVNINDVIPNPGSDLIGDWKSILVSLEPSHFNLPLGEGKTHRLFHVRSVVKFYASTSPRSFQFDYFNGPQANFDTCTTTPDGIAASAVLRLPTSAQNVTSSF